MEDESENQIMTKIGELIATAPLLNSPPNLPDLIRKLQLIHFYFERVVNQDLTKFITLGKIMEQVTSPHTDTLSRRACGLLLSRIEISALHLPRYCYPWQYAFVPSSFLSRQSVGTTDSSPRCKITPPLA